MINGLLYALVFFSLIPCLVLAATGFDLRFYPEQSFQTINYEINFSLTYIYLYIFISFFILNHIKKSLKNNISENLTYAVLKLRKTNIIGAILSCAGIFLEFLDYLYIDPNTHWLDRERLEILPASLRFYINPILMFFTLISIINIVSSISLIRQKKYSVVISSGALKWIFLDTLFIILAIYNSGNRWYLALMGVFYFYISPNAEKRKILALTPLIILTGGVISFSIIAFRVGIDIEETVLQMLNFDNFSNTFFTSLITVTEGFNIPSLIMLAEHKLFDFDIYYALNKIISLPLPGSLFDKPPPFNQVVGRLLTNEVSELSLGIGIIGIFIYSFGVISIISFVFFIYFIKYFDLKIKNNVFTHCMWFCLFFSGYRFGFEFLIVHSIYFSILLKVFHPIKKNTPFKNPIINQQTVTPNNEKPRHA